MKGAEIVPIGTTFAERFRVEACLGSDASRGVYEAIDVERDSPCALKILRVDDPEALVRRARAVAELKHDHILRIVGTGADHGLYFAASELLRGADLASISGRSGPLPPERVVDFIRQLARALDAAHDKGLFHGGLCPASVFLTRRPDGTPLVVLLGLDENGLLERDSSRPYRAPEPGAPSRAGDVYALGHIAYALLTGEPFYSGDDPGPDKASERAQHTGVILPPDFDRWLSIASSRDPRKRFAGAHEAAAALELAIAPRSGKLDALSKTIPAEDDEIDERPSMVDPMGDTQGVGMTLSKAAREAIASVPRRPPVAARSSGRAAWIVIAVVAVAALILFAALRG